MKIFFLLFFLLFTLGANADSNFGPFLDKQIEMVNQINEHNTTQEMIVSISKEQEKIYSNALDEILADKENYLHKGSHASQIFALQKIIKLNKRHSNKYAVIRDEVLIKSYKVIDAQTLMIKDILRLLDTYDYAEFQKKLTELFSKNQIEVHSYDNVDYSEYLSFEQDSKVIKDVHKNIKDFYALLEVNADVLKFISLFDKKIFTLNKYSQFSLVKPILFINDLEVIKFINPILSAFGFNVVKLIIILFLVIFIYFIRKVLYNLLQRYIEKITFKQKYSKDIIATVRKKLETIILLINIELIIYVYNDFVSVLAIDRTFNIIYAFFMTFMAYKIINSIAQVQVEEIDKDSNSIKYEVINVGIKIVNFTIWIIGLLIMLFLAGVNLTAVLSGLGIGGFAIALAAKDSLANFFGTLSILFSDVFSQGDWIDVDGKEGTVIEIGLRVTTIRTFDNALISIPNASVSNKDVKNWSRRSLGRRIKMNIGIKYDSKISDIENAIDQIYTMLDKHPSIATKNTEFIHQENNYKTRVIRSKDDEKGVKKTLLVSLDKFGDSSINILVYCFSKTVDWSEWLDVKQNVMFEIMKILEENNLEFAFPSLSIYQEKDS